MDVVDFTNLWDADDSSLEEIYSSFGSGLGAHEEDDDISLIVVRILVCAFGLVGNMMVIFVILALQEYQKAVTHWYVLQLALADSIFLLTIPFQVVEDLHGEWMFSGGMCKVKETIRFLNYYSSIIFLMVMSVDRYIAVCHAFSKRLQKLRTKCAAYKITVIIWIASLLMCIPIMLYSDKRGIEPGCKCLYEFPREEFCNDEVLTELEDCIALYKSYSGESCSKIDTHVTLPSNLMEYESLPTTVPLNDADVYGIVYEMGCSYATTGTGWIGYLWFNFVVMFIIPFMIMSACYCSIALRLKQTRVRQFGADADITTPGKYGRKRTKSAASTKAEKNRIRVTFVCLVLVLLFLVCWLPFHVVHLVKIKGVEGSSAFCENLSAVSAVIAHLNSALNPYIYNFIGTRFARRLRSAAGSVKHSVKKQTLSLSSGGATTRYRTENLVVKKPPLSTNSVTVMTKIYKS